MPMISFRRRGEGAPIAVSVAPVVVQVPERPDYSRVDSEIPHEFLSSFKVDLVQSMLGRQNVRQAITFPDSMQIRYKDLIIKTSHAVIMLIGDRDCAVVQGKSLGKGIQDEYILFGSAPLDRRLNKGERLDATIDRSRLERIVNMEATSGDLHAERGIVVVGFAESPRSDGREKLGELRQEELLTKNGLEEAAELAKRIFLASF